MSLSSALTGLKVDQLPFKVVATDILIEGRGWVELVCQVHGRRFDEGDLPEVEVFSPEGEFIGSRRCMSAWLLGGPKCMHDGDSGGFVPFMSILDCGSTYRQWLHIDGFE